MSVLFNAVYAAPDVPLWLSALSPVAAPANLQLSTLTVNGSGGIIMRAGNNAPPGGTMAGLSFLRFGNNPIFGTQLRQIYTPTIPGKGALPGTYTTLAPVTQNATFFDDLAVGGLPIYGFVDSATGLSPCVGYLTKTANTNDVTLYTPNFRVEDIIASTLTVSSINGAIGTQSTVSTFTNLFTQNASISSLTVSSILGGNLPVQVVSSVTTNTQNLITSSIQTTSKTGEVIANTIGSIVQGIAGSYAASAGSAFVGTALGAAGLATGLAGLYLSRTSGGVDTTSYQTINGTTQFQYSTLGAATTSKFLTTISPDPNNIPSTLSTITTNILPGTYCVRAVSDPINLANNSGQDGEAIQAFNQWTPVFAPNCSINMSSSVIKEYTSGNFIDFYSDPVYKRMTISTGQTVINSQYGMFLNNDLTVPRAIFSLSTFYGSKVYGDEIFTSSIQSPNPNFNTRINFEDGFSTIGIYPGIVTSTITTSSLTVTALVVDYSTITSDVITTSTLNVRNVGTVSSLNTNLVTTSTLNATQGASVGGNLNIANGFSTIGDRFCGNLGIFSTSVSVDNYSLSSITNESRASTLTVLNSASFSSLQTRGASVSSITDVSTINGAAYPPAIDSTRIQNLAGNVFVSADVSSVTVSTNSVFFKNLSTITPYSFANPPTNFLTFDPGTALTQNATVASMFASLFNTNVFGAYLPTTWPGYGLTVPTTCVNIVISNLRIMAGVVYKTPPQGGGSSNLTFSIPGTSFSYAAGTGIGFGNTAIMAFTQPIEPVTVTNIAATQAPRNCYTNYNGGTGLIDVFIASPTINDAQPFTPEASWMSAYYWCLIGGTFGTV